MNIKKNLPLFLGIIAVILYQLYWFGFDLTFIPGDLGDSRFNMYLLEHAYQYFTGQTPTLWTAPFMYPEFEVITYSDNLLGTAPIYGLFRIFGAGRELSFQFWIMAIAVLNFVCTYAFLNWQFKNRWSALFGGLMFATSLALVGQFAHAQTFPRFAIPLAFWALSLYVQTSKPKYFFYMVLLIVFQFYCAIYLGLFLAISIGVFLLVALIIHHKTLLPPFKKIKYIIGHFQALAIGILLFLPLYLPYSRRTDQIGDKPWEEVLLTLPSLRSYFSISEASWWNNIIGSTDIVAFWDHWIFPGILGITGMLFLFGITLYIYLIKKDKNKTYLLWSIASFMALITFLRFGNFSVFEYLRELPGLGGLRSITRIINIQLLFFAFGLAAFIQYIQSKNWVKSSLLIACIGVIFIVETHVDLDHISRYKKSKTLNRTSALKKKIESLNLPERTVISYQPDTLITHPVDYQIDAMLAAQSLHLRCVNGYSSMSPDGFASYWTEPNQKNLEYWFWVKEKPSTDIIVVH